MSEDIYPNALDGVWIKTLLPHYILKLLIMHCKTNIAEYATGKEKL